MSNPVDDWVFSAIEAAKVWCRDRLDRAAYFTRNFMSRFENSTCINECYGRGTCINGQSTTALTYQLAIITLSE